jgi:hypothetical protein
MVLALEFGDEGLSWGTRSRKCAKLYEHVLVCVGHTINDNQIFRRRLK